MLETESKGGPIGILAALAGELGLWRGRGEVVSSAGGLEVRRVVEAGEDVLVCVGGVGKVAAARGAEALLRCGVERGLLVVGTCGAVSRDLAPGELVHCGMAVQADLGVVEGREVWPDEGLRMAWEAVVEGPRVQYLTADRALMSGWRRWRVRRGCSGPCVAEMETAAAGACARAWGVPWAALRAVTDRAGWGSGKAFQKRYPVEAGRAADSVAGILARLSARG